MINESYAKDISNKVRSSLKIRKQKGDYIMLAVQMFETLNPTNYQQNIQQQNSNTNNTNNDIQQL